MIDVYIQMECKEEMKKTFHFKPDIPMSLFNEKK